MYLKPSHSVYCFPLGGATAGAGFKEYWTELLEHVVWRHAPWVLKLTDAPVSEDSLREKEDPWIPLRCSQNFVSRIRPWINSSPTFSSGWQIEEIWYSCAVRSWWLIQSSSKTLWSFYLMPLDSLQEGAKWIASGSCPPWACLLLSWVRCTVYRDSSSPPFFVSAFEEQEQQVVQFTSQFLKLRSPWDLCECPSSQWPSGPDAEVRLAPTD